MTNFNWNNNQSQQLLDNYFMNYNYNTNTNTNTKGHSSQVCVATYPHAAPNGAGPLFGNQRQPIAKLTKSTNTKYIKNTFN